jgi:hypothetical protein
MLSDGLFVELLINQKYNYFRNKNVLRKCTAQAVRAAGSVWTMERDKHFKTLPEFESRTF